MIDCYNGSYFHYLKKAILPALLFVGLLFLFAPSIAMADTNPILITCQHNVQGDSITPQNDWSCDTTLYLCQPQEICIALSGFDLDGDSLSLTMLEGGGTFNPIYYCPPPINTTHCFTPDTAGVYCFVFELDDDHVNVGVPESDDDIDTVCVTVVYIPGPQITCPVDISVDCASSTDPSITGYPTVYDEYDPNPSVIYSDVQNGRVITRTWIATNNCGQSAQCDQIITLVDSTPPVFTSCPLDMTVECIGDVPPPDLSLVSATDDCDPNPTIIFFSDTDDGLTCPKTITRKYKAYDSAGNISFCTQIITVMDTTPPVLSCPADITIDCAAPPDPTLTGTAGVSDNCSANPVVTYSDATVNNIITRTWTATDECGNSSQCSQTITLLDSTAPTLTCPPDVSVQCSADIPPADINSVGVSDDCDSNPVVTFIGDISDNLSCPETISRTYRATDATGNYTDCTQVITVMDDTPPVLSCPADITIDCSDIPDPILTGTAGATDNCSANPVVTYSDATVNNVITRTWTATDECGNSSQCSQTITLLDSTAPTLTCPPNVLVQCSADIPLADINTVGVSDDCDLNPVVSFMGDVSDGLSCPETITRTYRATDAAGNYTDCTQLITVMDTAPPTLSCPADITIDCAAIPDPSLTGTAGATDNCSADPVVAYSDATVNNVITRTWTATDDCGNSSQCVQLITLLDSTAPILTCPLDVSVQCSADVPPVDITSVGVSDDCDLNPVVTFMGDVSDGQSCPETISRTYRATDATGNYADCTQLIIVMDDTAPVLTCPNDVEVECGGSTEPIDLGFATATDNCSTNLNVTYSDVEVDNVITRTWSTTDDCGNVGQCDQIITIIDSTPPDLLGCPTDQTLQCTAEIPTPDISLMQVEDACDLSPTIVHLGDVSDGNSCPEVITRTYRATDGGGNYTDCVQLFTILDTVPPELTCPLDLTISCSDPTDPEFTGNPQVSDNCDTSPQVSYSDDVVDLVITRTWTAADLCGNTSQCVQTITVSENQAPILECPTEPITQIIGDLSDNVCLTDIPHYDPDGELATVVVNGITMSGTDICFVPENWGPNQVTVNCTDNCGASTQCNFTVIVGRCIFRPGDANIDTFINIADVIDMLDHLKGNLTLPGGACDCSPEVPYVPFYGAGDVNGDCVFNVVDVVYLYDFLSDGGSPAQFCPLCPPTEGWLPGFGGSGPLPTSSGKAPGISGTKK